MVYKERRAGRHVYDMMQEVRISKPPHTQTTFQKERWMIFRQLKPLN